MLWGINSDILSDILSGINSDIISGINSDIFSGILSGINPDILSDILSGINSDILSGILSGFNCDIFSGILSGINSDIFSGILFGIYSDSFWHVFGSSRPPQHPELARWSLGPVTHCIIRRGQRKKNQGVAPLLKSSDFHLAGGELEVMINWWTTGFWDMLFVLSWDNTMPCFVFI